MTIKAKVVIIESERGWGQRVDDVKYFDSKKDAEDYCREYNKSNTDDVAPDWYMKAEFAGYGEI